MELLYGKRFSKDLDTIRNEAKVKKALLELIEKIRAADSLADLKGVRKIEGYQGYFRNKVDGLVKSPSPSLRGAKRRGNLLAVRALLSPPRFARNDKSAVFGLFTNASRLGITDLE